MEKKENYQMNFFNNRHKEINRVILNPLCSGIEKYQMVYRHEPYINFDNQISWRFVLVPPTAYVKGRDINDLSSYNLKLKK